MAAESNIPPVSIPPPPMPLDLQAISEAAPPSNIYVGNSEELERQAIEGDHKRAQQKKWHLQRIVLIFYYIAFSLVILLIAPRVLHLVLPCDCQWLTDEQIQGIDKLLFSGAIGSFIGSYLKKSID